MDATMVNAFLKSSMDTFQMAAGIPLTMGKPYVRKLQFEMDRVLILVGITGQMKGTCVLAIPEPKAKEIASAMMMGMTVENIDDIAVSALSEMGNMILGNASTILSGSGIFIDITPPLVQQGMHQLGKMVPENICVPFLKGEDLLFELNIAVERK